MAEDKMVGWHHQWDMRLCKLQELLDSEEHHTCVQWVRIAVLQKFQMSIKALFIPDR